MTGKIPHSVVWFLLVLALEYGLCQEPLLTLELYDLKPAEVTIKSGCIDGLVSDVDLFTVKGKVNKNGSDPNAFDDNSLFLQAAQNVSTDAWESQCQVNLTVCEANLNADCYCEREDNETGEYYLVMRIMVKSMYGDGGIRLIWNDGLNSTTPSVTSNVVGYYNGSIRDSCLPFLELEDLDPADVTINSGCIDGLVSDVDLFTVRGKVNRNGSDPNTFDDNNLLLQAVQNVSTDAWESQCQVNLTVCEANLTADCYCERADNETGEYYLVMRIMVKSMYADGGLRLIWNDTRTSTNPPITSNVVGYYHGSIRDSCLPFLELEDLDQADVTIKSGCIDGLVSDVDLFTVRGKVNRNGSDPNTFDDNNLLLQAVQNVSTDAWESQCQVNLTVCEANLTADCYCERADNETGEYYLVMMIKVKSMYADGGLRLIWNDTRTSSNPPITSNVVGYYHGSIRDSCLPFLKLEDLDQADVTINSGCIDGLVSDVDLFTVRGKVNRNGSDPNTFHDNNLFLQAVQNVSTDAWESQCKVNLTVCEANLTADCYCEREDNETGEYYLVMRIKVKSMYADGGLRLIWNDTRTSTNPPITSNVVGYYDGYIRDSCLPSMELHEVDLNETIQYSYCLDGLVSGRDFFTVKGRVNRNGSNPEAYGDTNLILLAAPGPSTNAWTSQCNLNLTVCGRDLTDNCYCESLDEETGDHHLVMRVKLESMYYGGKLMLRWNDDKPSLLNPNISSNEVDYYNGTIKNSCPDSLPFMELYKPDPTEIIKISSCVDALLSDVDHFTVRGKVNKNSSIPNVFDNTGLYLQASQNVSTDAWESQCGLNLSVCAANLTDDCYCENLDEDGYYHLVMKVMAKSIYSDGGLRFSWNDSRSPSHPPIASNVVDYYTDTIRERAVVTLEFQGDNGETLYRTSTLDDVMNFYVSYSTKMRNVSFCVLEPATNRSIQIEDGDEVLDLAANSTDPCVVLNLQMGTQGRNLTMTFTEMEGCERNGTYRLILTDSLPIMELFKPDSAEIIKISSCVDALLSDVDQFTVRGKVNKRGSFPNIFDDTGLYLQASQNVSTDAWASQCQLDLSVCAANLTDDCYCESLDEDGYYHLVMKVMAKSMFSAGGLRFSWDDSRSPSHPPIASNVVDYYNGPIRERAVVTAEIQGDNGETLYQSSTFDDVMDFYVNYTTKMRNVSFCVFELATNRFIQIEDGDLAANSTDSCVVLDLKMGTQGRNLTMTFTEMEGCERNGTYRLILMPVPQGPSGLTDREKMYIAIGVVLGILFLVLVAGYIFGCYLRKHDKKDHSPDETAKLENPEPEVIRTRL